jgi:hypothetical protein
VHDDVDVVDEDPFGLALPFDARRAAAGTEVVEHAVGDGLGLTGRRACGDDEEVGVADGIAYLKDDDVEGLLVCRVAGDLARQLLGLLKVCVSYCWSFGSRSLAFTSLPKMTTTVVGGSWVPFRTTPRPSIARMSWATGRAFLPARICVCL